MMMGDSLKELVMQKINEVLPEAQLDITQSNENLQLRGMNSIEFIKIILSLEEELKMEIPDEYFLITEMNTVDKICNVLSAVMNES